MKLTMTHGQLVILANLIACIAEQDKTEPDPKNLRQGWRTDRLIQDIDTLVVHKLDEPASFVTICDWAYDRIINLEEIAPEIEALLEIAFFRGERLQPVSAEREGKLLQMINDLQEALTILPEGARKDRCASLLDYNLGVFYDAYGKFELAAQAQNQAGLKAEQAGDMPNAAVCYFQEVFYNLKQALCAGDINTIESLAKVLEMRYKALQEKTRGTDKEDPWGNGNGPWHLIQGCIWRGAVHPRLGEWIGTFLRTAQKLGMAWEAAAQLVSAFKLHISDNSQAEEALIKVANDVNQTNENRATALLILARRALATGDKSVMMNAAYNTAERYVSLMPEMGTQHVRAIAARLLRQ